MNSTNHKTAAKSEDFLVTVARSIGSTLGAVAAKVSPSPRRPATHKRVRNRHSVSTKTRRTSARISKSSAKAAGLKRKNPRKSSK
jgi:hypothetical protein